MPWDIKNAVLAHYCENDPYTHLYRPIVTHLISTGKGKSILCSISLFSVSCYCLDLIKQNVFIVRKFIKFAK